MVLVFSYEKKKTYYFFLIFLLKKSSLSLVGCRSANFSFSLYLMRIFFLTLYWRLRWSMAKSYRDLCTFSPIKFVWLSFKNRKTFKEYVVTKLSKLRRKEVLIANYDIDGVVVIREYCGNMMKSKSSFWWYDANQAFFLAFRDFLCLLFWSL